MKNLYLISIRKLWTIVGIFNILLTSLGIYVLYFTSLFWMGTKEDYDRLIEESYWSFFASRLLFNVFVGLVITILIGIVDWIILKITKDKNINILKPLAMIFAIFTIFSAIIIALQFSK